MEDWALSFENLRELILDFGFKAAQNSKKNLLYYIQSDTLNSSNIIPVGIIWDISKNGQRFSTSPGKFRKNVEEVKSILGFGIRRSMDFKFLYFSMDEKYFSLYIVESEKINLIEELAFYQKKQMKRENKSNINQNIVINSKISKILVELFQYIDFASVKRLLKSAICFSYIFSNSQIPFKYGTSEIADIFGLDSIFYKIGRSYLREYYDNNNMQKELSFAKWIYYYQEIYDKKELTLDFFVKHSYFSLILKTLLYFSIKKTEEKNHRFSLESYKNIIKHNSSLNINLSSFDPFLWGFKVIPFIEILELYISKKNGIQFLKMDLFSKIYQEFISHSTRQSLGEYYTPKELVLLMINDKINFQKKILDPSCGSGSFLIEILKKWLNSYENNENEIGKNNKIENNNNNKYIDNISEYELYAVDINPISVQVVYTNLILLLKSHFVGILEESKIPSINIFLDNAIFPEKQEVKEIKADFIVGNPPWINLSGLYSENYKLKIKNLAQNLNILLGVEAKNTEICTIFLYQCRILYLKQIGEIFFVMPASVLNGRQHVFFRYFDKLENIEIWRFTGDIFKIHNICFYARNEINLLENKDEMEKRLVLTYNLYSMKNPSNNNGLFQFMLNKVGSMKPIYIKWNKKNNKYPMIGGYNSIDSSNDKDLKIVYERSHYYKYVKGGIRIVPRRFVVIKEKPPFSSVTKIHPDFNQQAKPNWANPPYKEFEVESEYIYPFFKSQGLIPFTFVNIEYAFIPINISQKTISNKNYFDEDTLKPLARNLFNLLDSEYRKRIKDSHSMKTLIDNFTYNGRLIPTNIIFDGKEKYMVIHNSIGSIVKSAVIKDSIILDNSIYYFITDNENEAYYLSGVLNSNLMTEFVKKIGSTGSRGSLRNIHKNPYNFNIPKYEKSDLFDAIAELTKEIELYVLKFICLKNGINFEKTWRGIIPFLKNVEPKIKPRTIQNQLLSDENFKEFKEKLNLIVRKLF